MNMKEFCRALADGHVVRRVMGARNTLEYRAGANSIEIHHPLQPGWRAVEYPVNTDGDGTWSIIKQRTREDVAREPVVGDQDG